jgi:hypothetical protein
LLPDPYFRSSRFENSWELKKNGLGGDWRHYGFWVLSTFMTANNWTRKAAPITPRSTFIEAGKPHHSHAGRLPPSPVRGEIFVVPENKNSPAPSGAVANTDTQIYIQIVFAVEGRQSLIDLQHNAELQKYICGIISGQKQKLIANNMPDHVHILVGFKPDLALSNFVRDIDERYIFSSI